MKTLLVRLVLLGALVAVVWFALLPLRGPVPPIHDDAIDGTLTGQVRMRQGVMLLGYVLVAILALVVVTWRRKPRSTPEGYAVPPASPRA